MIIRPGVLVALTIAGMLAAGGRVYAQEPAAVEGEVVTAPVEIDGQVLFNVRGVTSYPAATRAGLIQSRIIAIAHDRTVPADAVRVDDSQGIVRIVAREHAIMMVADADAALEQVSRDSLASAHALRVRQAVIDYRQARTASALWRALGRTLVAGIILAIAVGVVAWFWRWADRQLRRRLPIQSVGIQSFEFVGADRIWAALHSGLLALRTVILLVTAFVFLTYALGQWPWTRSLSGQMIDFALDPLQVLGRGLVGNIPRIVFLIVLFLVLRLALRAIRLFFDAVGRGTVEMKRFDPEWAQPTYKIVRFALIAFGLIVAYPYIPGSQSEAFKGVSLFIGVVFSLGSSSAISNIIAGYMMTYRRAFKVGDRVRIGEAVGDVIDTRLQVTHLRTYKNEEIVIPNSVILSGEVLNYSSLARTHALLLHTEVGIGYDTSWRQVESMLLEAAARTEHVTTEPRPFVLLKRLGDFAITYELNAPCREVPVMNAVYSALHRNILDVFNEYGVQIMTPAYEGDPEQPKIVAPSEWQGADAHPSSAAGRKTGILP
jgi:small-conductance mechanosensitive channel